MTAPFVKRSWTTRAREVAVGALPPDWGLPELTPTNEAWFTSGALAIQKCRQCATLQHPPEEICHVCGGMVFDVEVVAPRGTVHSYTVVHYPANPALADAVRGVKKKVPEEV